MKPRPEIYDAYWYFAAERQNIFFKKMVGDLPPHTSDPILAHYKFCNVYRAADRVSQFLIKEVQYNDKHSPEDLLFRSFLFRLLNKPETWVALEKKLGAISLQSFSPGLYSQLLSELKTTGPIYGNAFILCANKSFGFDAKHDNHLALLEYVFLKSEKSKELLGAQSLQELFAVLHSLPLIGDFMAYQLAIDFNYSLAFHFNENDYTVAGPGAIRGIRKCFEDIGTYSEADIIMYMVENQTHEFTRLGLSFQTLGGRSLHAIDCQGLFCEVDKYSRVRFPHLASNRKQIKQAYTPHSEKITYFFPPKWHLSL